MTVEELEMHSPLGPSSADRWINCPGSVKATEDLPDVTSQFAAEGTFAHWISEIARTEKCDPKDLVGYTKSIDGFVFECDHEMAAHVEDFIDYINDHKFDHELVEERVSYDAWVDGGFGTLDAGLLNDGTCIVIDLKYGKGVQVFAEDNSQLKLYALGMVQEYSHLYAMEKFKLCIFQPRLGHVDEWEISIEDLLEWAEMVEQAADLALSEDAPFNPGSWCQWCKIRGSCRVRADAMRESLLDEISEVRDPNEMTDEEIGQAMSLVPLMKKWCSDIESVTEKLVLSGHEVIGEDGLPFKIVEGRSVRQWADVEAAEKAMRAYKIKVGDMFVKKLISPSQAEKLASIGKDHPILKNHCVKPRGKPVLVPGSDKRPAYKDASLDEL